MAITRVYLGNPLSPYGMQQIPAIRIGASVGSGSAGMSPTFSRATAASTLISGGVAVQRKPHTKSAYQIVWQFLGASDSDLLTSFFDGRQGGGPYCLVDPSQSNFLPPNVAGMGSVLSALPEWSPTAGTFAVSTAAAPTGLRSGVGQWSGASNGSIMYMGLNNIIDGTWLPPIVSGCSMRFDIQAKLLSGTGSLACNFLAGLGGGAPSSVSSVSAVALNSSTWTTITARTPSTNTWTSSQDYADFSMTVSSASSPVILLSAPSFVYDTITNANALSPWVSGIGVPRCLIVGDAPSPVGRPGLRDYTLTLQEA